MSIILITGTSSGIGRSAVELLAKKGATVIATARKLADIKDLKGPHVETMVLDVTDDKSRRAAVAAVIKKHGRIDALVNNAGYGAYLPMEESTPEALHAMFNVNVFGLHELTRLVLPHMRAQAPGRGQLRGRIVNVSSIAGHVSIAMMGGYCATKFALRAMTTALDQEVRHFGIRASLVEPGRILTEFGNRAKAETAAHAAEAGPYAGFYRRWGRIRLNDTGAKPAVIGRRIRRACLARRPSFHYMAPWDSWSTNIAKRLLPDAFLNALVAWYTRPSKRA